MKIRRMLRHICDGGVQVAGDDRNESMRGRGATPSFELPLGPGKGAEANQYWQPRSCVLTDDGQQERRVMVTRLAVKQRAPEGDPFAELRFESGVARRTEDELHELDVRDRHVVDLVLVVPPRADRPVGTHVEARLRLVSLRDALIVGAARVRMTLQMTGQADGIRLVSQAC